MPPSATVAVSATADWCVIVHRRDRDVHHDGVAVVDSVKDVITKTVAEILGPVVLVTERAVGVEREAGGVGRPAVQHGRQRVARARPHRVSLSSTLVAPPSRTVIVPPSATVMPSRPRRAAIVVVDRRDRDIHHDGTGVVDSVKHVVTEAVAEILGTVVLVTERPVRVERKAGRIGRSAVQYCRQRVARCIGVCVIVQARWWRRHSSTMTVPPSATVAVSATRQTGVLSLTGVTVIFTTTVLPLLTPSKT